MLKIDPKNLDPTDLKALLQVIDKNHPDDAPALNRLGNQAMVYTEEDQLLTYSQTTSAPGVYTVVTKDIPKAELEQALGF